MEKYKPQIHTLKTRKPMNTLYEVMLNDKGIFHTQLSTKILTKQ